MPIRLMRDVWGPTRASPPVVGPAIGVETSRVRHRSWSGRVGRRRVEKVGDHADRPTQVVRAIPADAGPVE